MSKTFCVSIEDRMYRSCVANYSKFQLSGHKNEDKSRFQLISRAEELARFKFPERSEIPATESVIKRNLLPFDPVFDLFAMESLILLARIFDNVLAELVNG